METEPSCIEEGTAYMQLMGLDGSGASGGAATRASEPRTGSAQPERFDVIVIGGGQAGLSVGYHLAQQGLSFVILDASARVGDAWRKRWDSLRLFSPRYLDGLAGLPFPGQRRDDFPTKDEMADYLEAYAAHFALPVRSGVQVDGLSQSEHGNYLVRAGAQRFEAAQVVIAIGNYQKPRSPAFASELASNIVQLHSADYRSPSQLQSGPVLIVGAGNSGAEIALELSRRQPVFLAGDNAAVPFDVASWFGRNVLARLLMRVVFHRVLTVRTPIGRKARPQMLHETTPLIRTRFSQLTAAGVERVARVAGVSGGKPTLEDGRVLDVTNVVFCTGYVPGFSWIELPICDAHGEPEHTSGIVERAPGLYFVGLHFLYAMSSGMIHGVGRDAARIAHLIRERANQSRAAHSETAPRCNAA